MEYAHKSRLQEYTQRTDIPFPQYETHNEGSQHAPQFRTTVVVDGKKFVSPCTFSQLKAAEQHAAKYALEGIIENLKHEGVPMIYNDTVFCKSILHEYTDKQKLEKPTYTTSESAGLLPSFQTSVLFLGKTFIGSGAKSKKEAEQIGARAVIEWILGQSNAGTVIYEIVKSKGRLFNAIQAGNGSTLMQNKNMSLEDPVEKNSAVAVELPVTNESLQENSIAPGGTNPKERNICEMCSKSINRTSILPTLPHDNPPQSSTSMPDNASNGSFLPQIIMVKTEVPSSPPMLSEGSKVTNGKRSGKKRKGGSSSKKARL